MGFLGRLSKVNFDILALLRALLLFSKTFLVACPYGANFRYPRYSCLTGSSSVLDPGALGTPGVLGTTTWLLPNSIQPWIPACRIPRHTGGGISPFCPFPPGQREAWGALWKCWLQVSTPGEMTQAPSDAAAFRKSRSTLGDYSPKRL